MSASSIPVAVGNPEEYQFATFIADRQPRIEELFA